MRGRKERDVMRKTEFAYGALKQLRLNIYWDGIDVLSENTYFFGFLSKKKRKEKLNA